MRMLRLRNLVFLGFSLVAPQLFAAEAESFQMPCQLILPDLEFNLAAPPSIYREAYLEAKGNAEYACRRFEAAKDRRDAAVNSGASQTQIGRLENAYLEEYHAARVAENALVVAYRRYADELNRSEMRISE